MAGIVPELLRPPLGFAAVEVLLELCDVHGEVALTGRESRLELGAGLLALLEPLLADLELGLELCLPEVQSGIALLQLLRAGGENLLPLVEPLLLALVAAPRGEDCLLGLVQPGLPRRELFVTLLQAALGELVDLGLVRFFGSAA